MAPYLTFAADRGCPLSNTQPEGVGEHARFRGKTEVRTGCSFAASLALLTPHG